MNITVFATSQNAARELLSLGLVGLDICDKAGNDGLESALSGIDGISVKCANGDDGFECHIGPVDSSAVLSETATIELHCGKDGNRKFSVTPAQGQSVEEMVKAATESLSVKAGQTPAPDNAPKI